MTKSTITRERIQQIFLGNGPEPSASEERELARMALAAMDGEPVAATGNGLNVALSLTQMQIDWICNTCASIYNTRNDDVAQGYIDEIRATLERLAAMDSEPVELPLDYLQGRKDGLEWAARLAEANHPDTGDWLYDDPIELSKAIRKGRDMPPVQPVADSEPVIVVGDDGGDALSYRRLIQSFEPGTKLYRHAQPAPVVPVSVPDWIDRWQAIEDIRDHDESFRWDSADGYEAGWNACRAAMLAAAPQSPGGEPATVPGKWIPVSERMPDDDDFVYIWPRPDFGVELHVGQYCERSHKGGGWYAQVYEQNYGIEWHPITVTHWMPLPAGPQEVR